MRFKTFMYHFLVASAAVILMGLGGYFSLEQILKQQLETELRNRASFVSLVLENPRNKDREQQVIDDFGIFDGGMAWVIDSTGKFVAYPRSKDSSSPFFKEREELQVNPLMTKDDVVPVVVGKGLDQQMVYSERLQSGNFLVVGVKSHRMEQILSDYSSFMIYGAIGIIFGVFYLMIFLSRETLKPLFSLQEYARNLALGEYIDRPDSLKEPDVVSIASVLEKYYIWSRREESLDENPMSGLPGNKSLYDSLFRLIEEGGSLAVGFVDANDFTAYNNKYGVERGDSVIRFMGMIIFKAIRECGSPDDKIYHLGADRFIFTTAADRAKAICKKIVEDFDDQIAGYYDEKARQEGYIISTDKNDVSGKFPFMPICIGVATNQIRPLNHPLQVGHIVGQIRNYLKNRQASDYLIDRRTTDREEEYTGHMAPFPEDERKNLGTYEPPAKNEIKDESSKEHNDKETAGARESG